MPRLVTPELLDSLPADSPAARHSRRDLRWLNRCMRNPSWWRRQLARELQPHDRVLELGAGDRSLRVLAPAGVEWHAIDLAPPPEDWPSQATWHQSDLRTFDRWQDYSVVVGNLILHHLHAPELALLGAAVQRHARLFLACEPSRSLLAAAGLRLLCPLLRFHAVTRHDARVSIRAGFRRDELLRAMGFDPIRWRWRIDPSLLGSHRVISRRQLLNT